LREGIKGGYLVSGRISRSLLRDLADVLVHSGEVVFEFGNEQVELAHVHACALGDDSHEDVLADLHLLDEVLVVHDSYLEVAARAQLLELVLEVGVENVDTAAQTSQKVVVNLGLQLEVVAEPAEHLSVVLELS